MAEYSYFEFACICGIQYRVRYEGTYRCPCGRILELDWSYAAREAASTSPEAVNQAGQKALPRMNSDPLEPTNPIASAVAGQRPEHPVNE